MEQEEIDGMLREVIAQARAAGIPVSERILPHVVWNKRATGRFGCCKRQGWDYLIELSERMKRAPRRSCMQTLAHEVLHTCRGCSNHGETWKAYAARMNAAYAYEISRTDTCEKLGVPDGRKVRYRLRCDRCGTEIGRTKRSPLVEHPERYRCRCGGKLRLLEESL